MRHSKNRLWELFFHSAESMYEINNCEAQLVVTSPPYTDRIDGYALDKNKYCKFLQRVFKEIFRILMAGGVFITINTDLRDHARYNKKNTHYDGLIWQKHIDIKYIAESIGFKCFDLKIWVKTLRRSIYRYAFSYIQFFYKPGVKPSHPLNPPVANGFGLDVWLLEKGTYRRDSRGYTFRNAIHPEIVYRCVEQFTSSGDLVVSPFTGSGTILAISVLMGRRCIGYEINKNLEHMIKESINTPERFSSYRNILANDLSK